MYECAVMRQDAAWYSEMGITRGEQRLREDRAVDAMLPDVAVLLEGLDVAEYVTAPIVSSEAWKAYAAQLPTFVAGDGISSDKSIERYL